MSKATCSRCGHEVFLVGDKEFWTIAEAMRELIDKMKLHKCKVNPWVDRKIQCDERNY